MPRKLIITTSPDRIGFVGHSPNPDLVINDWEISVNPASGTNADFWIVYGNARPKDSFLVSAENTLLVVLEPECKKIYPRAFYRQFYRIVDTHRKSEHPRVDITAPCFPWHVGLNLKNDSYQLSYNYLNDLQYPEEIKNKV